MFDFFAFINLFFYDGIVPCFETSHVLSSGFRLCYVVGKSKVQYECCVVLWPGVVRLDYA